ERDLSNSANERFTLPMAAILLDEMLDQMTKVISGLTVNKNRITSNLEITKGQIYAEFLLEALVKKGIPRFDAYRDIQRAAFAAAEQNENFLDAVGRDASISKHLSVQELRSLFTPGKHLAASGKLIENVARTVGRMESSGDK